MANRPLRPGFETARLKLARIRVEGAESRERAAKYLTRVTAEALSCKRVGLWSLRNQGQRLVCVGVFASDELADSEMPEIDTRSFRGLLEELDVHRVLVRSHAEARLWGELFESYLARGDERSVLVAPVIREGRVTGLILVEVDPTAEFGQRDIDFVSSVADLAALSLEQADRIELEAAIQANAELRHEQQKSQALLRVCRAVGHDIKGLMQVFLGISEYLEGAAASGATSEELKEWAAQLSETVRLGGELTLQLLTFGGELPEERKVLDLNAEISKMQSTLRALLNGKGELFQEVLTEDPRAVVSASALQQILLNLVGNSAAALREGGKVVVRLREPSPEEPELRHCLIVEVEDDGRGMDEATLARAVEPYFTTRKDGHGIGLATVAGAVRACGGTLVLSSQLGRGTLVTMSFPRFEGAALG